MATTISIRRYREGDGAALFEIHCSAIRLVARRDYAEEQIAAWAPQDLDSGLWRSRIRRIDPFVATLDGHPVGYADLQPTGYIDQFFVSGHHAGRCIGTRLMQHLLTEATGQGLIELTSNVSRTAQPLFLRFGFEVVEQRFPQRQGIIIPNASMRKVLMSAVR